MIARVLGIPGDRTDGHRTALAVGQNPQLDRVALVDTQAGLETQAPGRKAADHRADRPAPLTEHLAGKPAADPTLTCEATHRTLPGTPIGRAEAAQGDGGHTAARGTRSQVRALRSRRAFAMTETELKLIARAASIGLSRIPNAG